MKKPIIFLIATVFVVMNAAHSPENENYDVESIKNLRHTQQLVDHNEEDHEWLESGYKIESDDDVLTPVEDETAAEGAPKESNLLKRFKRKLRVCFGGCVNGTCVSLQKCKCKYGYVKSKESSKICVPWCKKTCVFGDCTDPDTCSCREDYEPTADKYTCKPKCYTWCNPGRCDQPYECKCNTGFELQGPSCRPAICLTPCKPLEFCARDNFCDCKDGYRKPQFSTADPYRVSACEPICHRSCPTQKCSTPNHCICNAGYKWNSSIAHCDPVCENPRCVNGFSCVSPNKCGCINGFLQNKTITTSLGATVETVCINRGTNSAVTSSTIFLLIGIIFTFYHM